LIKREREKKMAKKHKHGGKKKVDDKPARSRRNNKKKKTFKADGFSMYDAYVDRRNNRYAEMAADADQQQNS
jgi:hypothetical protein